VKIIVTEKWSMKIIGVYSDREIMDLELDRRHYSFYTQIEYDNLTNKSPLAIISIVKKIKDGYKTIKYPIYKLGDLKNVRISNKGNFFKEEAKVV